jgi:hypothetical protein
MAYLTHPGIEQPEKLFRVQFHHQAYQPDGVPITIPAAEQIDTVAAETPAGALQIAQYHRFLFGNHFQIMED